MLLAVVLIAGAAGYFLWLRDSSLVAVTDVEVVGVRVGDRERIVSELNAAAKEMTTLNLDEEALRGLALEHPTISGLEADANFPHGLRIEVSERPPVLVAADGEREVAVAGDGTLLGGIEAPDGLPRLDVEALPAEGRLGGSELAQALVVGAAPKEIAPLIASIALKRRTGVEVALEEGIAIRFGNGSRPEAQWAAALAVLADPKLDQLGYLDVSMPRRPTVGG